MRKITTAPTDSLIYFMTISESRRFLASDIGMKVCRRDKGRVDEQLVKCSDGSKMSHPRCVYINNRCTYQSITQQYLKICLIKDDSNYMFRHIEAIITFSSESMLVVLYRIGMVMSR